ncbi:MAG: MotA/TolQ/ExbB proton channel family protein [Kiritimatiellales bacterium]
MMAALFHELPELSAAGGPLFWALVALTFGIAYALISILRTLRQLAHGLRQTGSAEIGHGLFSVLDRRFPFAFVLISAAPLIGLLGTVSGMLTTFRGMGSSTAVSVDAVSTGVSQALITTQAGLVLGVSSLLFCSLLHFRCEQLRAGFRRAETAAGRS